MGYAFGSPIENKSDYAERRFLKKGDAFIFILDFDSLFVN